MSTSPYARRWRRVITTLSLAAITLVAGAGVAAAHVTVNPSEAAAGDFSKLTVRVPDESGTAGTIGLTVAMPADHPFASVSVKAVPGWTVILAVVSIVNAAAALLVAPVALRRRPAGTKPPREG